MAVTVKIEDKARKQAMASGPPPDLSDFVIAGERGEGTKAVLIWMLPILVLTVALCITENTRPFGIGIFAWWLLSCFIYFYMAPRMVLRRLRMHGADYEINARKHPRLKTLLSKASAMLALGEPEGFIVDDTHPKIRIYGGKNNSFIVITQGAMSLLQPAEVDTLVLRNLVHLRQGHVRRLMLLQFVNDTNPALRLLVWPAVFYSALLTNWQDLAAQTADRLTLLLMKNQRLLMSAILKLHAATDPLMQDKKITAQDVDNYIRQDNTIGTEGTEISTQYRLGSAIRENPFLEERIQVLNSFCDSDDFDAALEKLAAARSGKASPLDGSASGPTSANSAGPATTAKKS